MVIKAITPSDELWDDVKQYAEQCSWRAGKALAQRMEACAFSDWERVIVAVHDSVIYGYCTVSKEDCIPSLPYTPYIGFLFVDEEYRGHRLSQKLIDHSMAYLKSQGFRNVYLISDHIGLYEKYGFRAVEQQRSPWGSVETIYTQEL